MDQDGKWLLCRLGDVWHGLDLGQVQEIVYRPALTGLPTMGRSVAGIMEWLGHQVTVVEPWPVDRQGPLASELPQGQKPVVIIKSGDSFLGLLVDEVGKVISKRLGAKIEIDPSLLATIRAVDEAFEYNGEIIFSLNPGALQESVV